MSRVPECGQSMTLSKVEFHSQIDWPQELERHREWMRSMATARLGNPHIVDDVMQDVSLAVIQQNNRPTNPDKIRSWLYQIVVRRCADLFRKEFGEERRAEQWAERATKTRKPCGDWVMVAERQHRIVKALEQLSEDDQRMFLMKHRDNCSYQTIAREFGVTERVVEYRLHRSKLQLREQLRHLMEDDE